MPVRDCSACFWRSSVMDMLFAFQFLFLLNVAWDFFLTIIVNTSHGAAIFAGLSPVFSILLVLFWIGGILLLSTLLLSFIKAREIGNPIAPWVQYGYGIMAILYSILLILAILNPAAPWPFVIHYLVNVLWASALIYFRQRVLTKYF